MPIGMIYAQDAGAANKLRLPPVPDVPADFICGADVSTLMEVERLGGTYTGLDGVQKDLLSILKDNGVNWIRLRLWNNPVNAQDVVQDGKTISKAGDPVGGGNNDLAKTIAVATRAKALGLKVLLDFHYSDFWTDPGKQNKPAAWANMDLPALQKAIYAYTKDVLAQMAAAQALPDMVQIGNELNGGLLWPEGKTWQENPREKIGGYDGFASLLSQASKAVRDSQSLGGKDKRISIAIHLADGGNQDLYRKVFDQLSSRGLDFDIIGMSFYPYWHGSLDDLAANMQAVTQRFHKPVVVMETAYGWTLKDGDGWGNLYGVGYDKMGGYQTSVLGQASMIRDLAQTLVKVPGKQGLGLFYWEPAWIPVKGLGWRTGEGNAWENQALFDFTGKALPSLEVFKQIRSGDASVKTDAVAADPVELTIAPGEKAVLPGKVRTLYSDDSWHQATVSWAAFDTAGRKDGETLDVAGKLEGSDLTVHARIIISLKKNLIEDPSFETGALGAWKVSGSLKAVMVEKNPGNAHSGDWSYKYWLDKPFNALLTRTFTKLQNGTYALRGWTSGGGGEKTLKLFARDFGGQTLSIACTNTGWQQWKRYEIPGIKVTNGQCTIGLYLDADGGVWGNLDDLEFVRVSD